MHGHAAPEDGTLEPHCLRDSQTVVRYRTTMKSNTISIFPPIQGIKPGPAEYQRVEYSEPKPMYKPFGSDRPRLPADKKSIGKLGPGSYCHNVPMSRHVEYNESFGGERTLKGLVTIRCTKGIPDKVGHTVVSVPDHTQ